MEDTSLQLGNRKLVVLGIPWEVNTDGLQQHMSKYGNLDDVVVMKDRKTGRSRGFGYVTFSTAESAEKALAAKHTINGREMEVKVATPKEEMKNPPRKITRIFVARIPVKVPEGEFRKYFEKYGTITDIYMPKEAGAKSHRGIGFITFESSDAVNKIMAETHELGGSTVAVDEATPKEEAGRSGRSESYAGHHEGSYLSKYYDREYSGAYGAYSPYIAAAGAAPRLGGYGGMSSYGSYDYPSSYGADYGSNRYGGSGFSPLPPSGGGYLGGGGLGGAAKGRPTGFGAVAPRQGGVRNRIFVGKLPSETTSEDLLQYFGNFGRISDVFQPKDPKGKGHRGFAFVTFMDEGPADRVCRRPHELLGHEIAVEHASPLDEAGGADAYPASGGLYGSSASSAYAGSSYRAPMDYYSGYGGGSYGGGVGPMVDADRAPRGDLRYRPY
ncbi:hypothetical protein GOP47_0023275 [Adiantum capillus-veneris]|uniref:RRM domain-containing protein n=1 Tax=Adiantum capillus-veneris TaxID=13818 RepID=A0A9D4U726_ADICA|nr:hypothetical protein GOP47_0022852 [Adiantum capillus-veneris]KAI5062736.1 hypothetical protein GOP47_0023275 [Adiantum capillus-veneris]